MVRNWKEVPVPERMRSLPRDPFRQFPIIFSQIPPIPDWVPSFESPHDFRAVLTERVIECAARRLCGVCGQPLDYWIAFLGGPLSAKNRAYTEPPMHPECARYAVQVCPYMVVQAVPRRESGAYGDLVRFDPTGTRDKPPAFGLYLTRSFKFEHSNVAMARRDPHVKARIAVGLRVAVDTRSSHWLFTPGTAKAIEWYREGERVDAP